MALATVNGHEFRYDWQLCKALYVAGMNWTEIQKVPQFREMSMPAFYKRKRKEQWDGLREDAKAAGAHETMKGLMLQLQQAVGVHRQFMLDQLAHERFVLEKAPNRGLAGKHQRERLENLRMIDEMGRKSLGMDKEAPLSAQQKQMAILIHVSTNGVQQKPIQGTLVNESQNSNGAIEVNISTQSAPLPYEDTSRDMSAEVAAIIKGREIEPEEEENLVPRPGFAVPKPLKVVEETLDETLVNESDPIITACKETFPEAEVRVINEGSKDTTEGTTEETSQDNEGTAGATDQ